MPRHSDPMAAGGDSEDDMMMGGGGRGGLLDPNRFMNVNYSREFLATLPQQIQKRVNGLLALDKKYKAAKDAYDAKRRELLRQFQVEVAAPIQLQRKKIILGEEPADEELIKEGFPEEHKKKDIKIDAPAESSKPEPLGDFWLRALQRHVIVNDMITERDEEVMKHCTDITVVPLSAPARGFVVRFEFGDNEFFTNDALTKTFHLKEIFDELTVERTEGTTINWKSEEKNVTLKVVSKKQKGKVKGKVVHRTIKKTLKTDSFFHFFSSSNADGEQEEDTDDIEEASDFADMDDEQWFGLATVLQDKIVPYAVEYFTCEANDGSSDLDEDDYDDDDDEDYDEDDEDDSDDDYAPMAMRGGRGGGMMPGGKRGGGGGMGGGAPAPGGKQDCKQQ